MSSKFAELMKQPLPSKVTGEAAQSNQNKPYIESGGDTSASNPEDLFDVALESTTTLTPAETERVNDAVKKIATKVFAGNLIGREELSLFKENAADSDIAIDEGYLTEHSLVHIGEKSSSDNLDLISALSIAREKQDPLYLKLVTLWKAEKRIEEQILAKYEMEVRQRSQTYLEDAKMSKSETVRAIAEKISND